MSTPQTATSPPGTRAPGNDPPPSTITLAEYEGRQVHLDDAARIHIAPDGSRAELYMARGPQAIYRVSNPGDIAAITAYLDHAAGVTRATPTAEQAPTAESTQLVEPAQADQPTEHVEPAQADQPTEHVEPAQADQPTEHSAAPDAAAATPGAAETGGAEGNTQAEQTEAASA